MKRLIYIFLVWLNVCNLFPISTTSQNLDEFSFKKGCKVNGGLSFKNDFYKGSDSLVNRDPYALYLNGNLNVNLWGISMPFSFCYSNTHKSYTQPFNRFKLDPRYKWVHLLIGTNVLELSKYTLSDHEFTGVGVELTPNKWTIAGMYGRLRKAVEFDPLENNYNSVCYKRMGYAAKVGYQSKFGGEYNVTFFHGEDKTNSLDGEVPDECILTPQKNTAVSAMISQKFMKYFFARAEYAFSLYNTNILNEDNEPTKSSSLVDKVFGKHVSDKYVDAFNGAVGYQGKVWGLSFNYERVAPYYTTLGGYYFTNDIECFTLAPNVKLVGGKLNLSGSFGLQYNNLDNKKANDTRNMVYSINASFNSGEHWTASLNFSNFTTYTKVKPQAYPYYTNDLDSLNFYQVSRSLSASGAYNWGTETVKDVVCFSASYQCANQLSEDSLTSFSDYFSGNVSFSQQYVPIKFGWSAFMMASYCNASSSETLYWGPGFSLSKLFFKDRLNTAFSTSYNVNDVSGMQKGSLLNSSLSASYTIDATKQKLGSHTFSLSSSYTKYLGGMATGDNSFEFLTSLCYRLGF